MRTVVEEIVVDETPVGTLSFIVHWKGGAYALRDEQAARFWRANYFRYGSVLRVRQKLDRFIRDRVRYFLGRRAKCPTRGTRRYPWVYVFGELGVVSLSILPRFGA